MGVVDIRTQGMKRHTALAIPFGPCDFGTAKSPCHVHPDAERTHAHGVLDRTLHRTTETDPPLELLGNAVTDERRVKFGLAHLHDVEMQFAVRHLREFLAQRLDIGALLADDDTRTRRVYRHAALLVRPFDDHPADAGLLAFAIDEFADRDILEQKIAVILRVGVPAAVPGAVDLQAHADRIDFVTH